jgi:hypothetical protein
MGGTPAIGGPLATIRDRRLPAALKADRPVLTNWQDAPCPACSAPLDYVSDLAPAERAVLILLRCGAGHHWQERLSLETLHSGVFVERRRDHEPPE